MRNSDLKQYYQFHRSFWILVFLEWKRKNFFFFTWQGLVILFATHTHGGESVTGTIVLCKIHIPVALKNRISSS